MSMRSGASAWIAIGVLAGCGTEAEGPPTTEDDVVEYDRLQAELEQGREVFTEGWAQDFAAAGNTLFYLTSEGGPPLLRSYDADSGQTTAYGFRTYLVGPSTPEPWDTVNFVATTSVVATMNELDGANAYAVGDADGGLGKLTLPAPPYGERWWPYAASGDDVYVVVIEDGKHHLKRWSPGDEAAVEVLALEDLIAPSTIQQLWGFAVSGTTLHFVDRGRAWIADLSDDRARWAQNEDEVLETEFTADRVIYAQGTEYWRYDVATDTRENLSEKIRANPYEINPTFAEVHLPMANGGWAVYHDKLIYEASYGLFVYDRARDVVEPLLLNARDNSVVYKHPTVLSSGRLFAVGLESSSGATGADGPTYMVPSRLTE